MTADPGGEATGPELVILKCETCGDAFPIHDEPNPVCPSCGGTIVHRADEPLL